jgi:hypothetical protein
MFNYTPRLAALTTAALSVLALQVVGSPLPVAAHSNPGTVTCTNNPAGDTSAVLAAIRSAGTNGTVTIAAGTCALTGRLPVNTPLTVTGAGAGATFLVEHSSSNIFQITAPGVTIENLNLDTATYNPGPAVSKAPKPAVLFSNASHTSILNVTAEAGSGFGMRVTGPSPCSSYGTTGTVVQNVNITHTGRGGFASLDIDCTSGATLSNLTIHGNYIALFQDANVQLSGETFTPDAKTCQAPWYITGPASNITITGVSGGGPGISKGTANNVVVTNQAFVRGC